jgi:hypothetical protein
MALLTLTSVEALNTKPGHLGEKDLVTAKPESPLDEDNIEQAEMPINAPQIISALQQPARPWKEKENLYNMPG